MLNSTDWRASTTVKSPSSTAQHNSYRLLREWWENTASDNQITETVKDWIQQAAALELPRNILPRLAVSRYNILLFLLWREEFCMPRARDSELYSTRMMAAGEAACHRLAFTFVTSPEASCASSNAAFECSQSTQISIGTFSSPISEQCITMTAAIEPCFWLDDKQILRDQSESPYFLWDTQEAKTIFTKDVGKPAYVAISHTWGRWRKPTYCRSLNVPWDIPENEIFAVSELPALLREAPFSERYVWFDLLCIPQERNNPRSRIEIANQAAIFKSAKFACAWLKVVPSWSGLKYAIEWLSVAYCNANGHALLPDLLEIKSGRNSTYLASLENDEEPLSGWFTSLWTLQEICLRPNMLLYDRNWQPLVLRDSLHIPFDHIVSLCVSIRPALGSDRMLWPRSVRELYFLLDKTGMTDLPHMSPTLALILGNQRECTERRAEAIMSVIGATSWFKNTETSPDLNLVLGRYPLVFVEEVKEKLGAVFFASSDQFFDEVNEIGTLLPFSNKSIGGRRIATGVLDNKDHPSTSTWKIRKDGSVLLPSAGIVASWPRRNGKLDELARVVVPTNTPGAPANLLEEVELHQYLGSFRPENEKHAIVLLRSEYGRVFGVLLEAQPQSGYKKFGVFFYNCEDENHKELYGEVGYQAPKVEAVNWVVI